MAMHNPALIGTGPGESGPLILNAVRPPKNPDDAPRVRAFVLRVTLPFAKTSATDPLDWMNRTDAGNTPVVSRLSTHLARITPASASTALAPAATLQPSTLSQQRRVMHIPAALSAAVVTPGGHCPAVVPNGEFNHFAARSTIIPAVTCEAHA